MLSNTADAALELPEGEQRMEQLNPVSRGVVGLGCLDLLLILLLEESSCGSLSHGSLSGKSGHTYSCTVWLLMGCFL